MDRDDEDESSKESVSDVSTYKRSEKNSESFTVFGSPPNKLALKLCRQPPRSYKM